ncbi:REST corepressor 2-like [Diaphorina citri]|uniref:REST corepressor 2-like n=1 Tax=Diaphorina citri TaxID=121845 RepID=A0A1S3DGH4_DIACI|nr:REST corepressor 2-like [Diaphorina citri]
MDLERNGQYSDSESVASDCSSNDEDKIHVGSEYQANVPNNVLDKSFCYLELDKSDSVWLPSKINFTNEELDQYLKHAYYTYNICEEQALSLLHTCCYDLNKARVTLTQTKCVEDTLDKWSNQEREHFINAYNYHGKKFKLIQASVSYVPEDIQEEKLIASDDMRLALANTIKPGISQLIKDMQKSESYRDTEL